ncbi:MAG TPA: ABC transporter ATP-binding protein, partial [Chthoniobacteraceae bacterium]|nr:ABC transporter ATP-binding protein [Chthoniobacteraceae bacterium]
AMVFQSYALYPHMTVFENIAVNLRLRRVPREEIKQRVAETARLLDIEPLLDRKPKELSGGQRQRVALGRAIIRNPEVFLLDEPLSNLDAILRERMRAELKALFAQIGATVIYVTHDQTEAMTMSSKIALLHEAKIQHLGTPEEIYDQPANTFVATFVGSPRINLLRARVAEDGVVFGRQKLRAPRSALNGCGEVLLGVRPEDIRVGSGDLEARVRSVEPLGANTALELDCDGQTVRALVGSRTQFDGAVKIGFDEERLHFFDPQTERRL